MTSSMSGGRREPKGPPPPPRLPPPPPQGPPLLPPPPQGPPLLLFQAMFTSGCRLPRLGAMSLLQSCRAAIYVTAAPAAIKRPTQYCQRNKHHGGNNRIGRP